MWKQIEELDYEINEQGVVRRISSKRIKKSFKRKDGYIGIQLYKPKYGVVNYQLHRLIAIAYIPNTLNKEYINHIDSNRENNSISNLEWVTSHENVIYGYAKGYASNKGSKNGFSKLTEEQVLEIRSKYTGKRGEKVKLAKEYNVVVTTITNIINNKSWKLE